jgi:hypothetical protein
MKYPTRYTIHIASLYKPSSFGKMFKPIERQPPNKNKPWSAKEVSTLREMAKTEAPAQIAKALKRTVPGVVACALKHNIRLAPRRPRHRARRPKGPVESMGPTGSAGA